MHCTFSSLFDFQYILKAFFADDANRKAFVIISKHLVTYSRFTQTFTVIRFIYLQRTFLQEFEIQKKRSEKMSFLREGRHYYRISGTCRVGYGRVTLKYEYDTRRRLRLNINESHCPPYLLNKSILNG